MRTSKLLSHRNVSWFSQDWRSEAPTPTQQGANILQQGDTQHSADTTDSGLVLSIGGVAGAVGDQTLAFGDVYSDVRDLGRVTIGRGYAQFAAAAESSTDAPAAFADTYANVQGADFVITLTTDSAGSPRLANGQGATASSVTRVFAIDFEGFDMPGGPRVVELSTRIPAIQLAHSTQGHTPAGDSHNGHWLTGNIATVSADAVAHGHSSVTQTDTFALTALTGSNAFSFVSGDSISGIA